MTMVPSMQTIKNLGLPPPPPDDRIRPLWESLKKSKLLPSQQQRLLDNYAYLLAAEDTKKSNKNEAMLTLARLIATLITELDNSTQRETANKAQQTYYQSAQNIVLGSKERKAQDEILNYLNASLRECSLIIKTAFDPDRLTAIDDQYKNIPHNRAEDETRIRTVLRHYHVHIYIIVTLEVIAAIVDFCAFLLATKIGAPVAAFALTEAYGLLSLAIVAIAPHLFKKSDELGDEKKAIQAAIINFKKEITTNTTENMVGDDNSVGVENSVEKFINQERFSELDDGNLTRLKSAYEELLRAVFTHEGPARTEALFVYKIAEQILDNAEVKRLLDDQDKQVNAVDYIEQVLKESTTIIQGKMTNYEKLSNSIVGMFIAACFAAAIYSIIKRPAVSATLLAAGLLAGWFHGLANKTFVLLVSDPETRKIIEEYPGKLASSIGSAIAYVMDLPIDAMMGAEHGSKIASKYVTKVATESGMINTAEGNKIKSNINIKEVQSSFKQKMRELKAQGTKDNKTSAPNALHQDPTSVIRNEMNTLKGQHSSMNKKDGTPVSTIRKNSFS